MNIGVVVIEKDKAATVLVVVDSQLGLAFAACTPKKGPHALTMNNFRQYLQQLGDQGYIILGDGALTSLSFLRSVEEPIDRKVRLETQRPARRSHQSIGQAENNHSFLAAQI